MIENNKDIRNNHRRVVVKQKISEEKEGMELTGNQHTRAQCQLTEEYSQGSSKRKR